MSVLSGRISSKTLAILCRALSTMLYSGVDIRKAFDLAAGKTSDSKAHTAMKKVGLAIRKGESIAPAMRDEHPAFPDMMCDMVDVAEQTGAMPEILEALADHYESNHRLKKNFITSLAWPVFQLVAAILIIAVLLVILGWIADSSPTGEPFDVLGLGLTGTTGALIWLMSTFGTIFALFFGYLLLSKSFLGKRYMDGVLMKIPVVGTCMQSFAIARFSWAYYLTQQAGLPVDKSLDASLRATGNGAFMAVSPAIRSMVREGEDLSTIFAEFNLFPPDYVEMVHVGETTGTVPEQLHRLGPQFEEQARRSLNALTATLNWVIWGLVAAFIIFIIFRVAFFYIGQLNDAINEAL